MFPLPQCRGQPVQPPARFLGRNQAEGLRRRELDVNRGGVRKFFGRVWGKVAFLVCAQFGQRGAGKRAEFAQGVNLTHEREAVLVFQCRDQAGGEGRRGAAARGKRRPAVVAQQGKSGVGPGPEKRLQNEIVSHAALRQGRQRIAPGFHRQAEIRRLAAGLRQSFVTAGETVGGDLDQGRHGGRGIGSRHREGAGSIAGQTWSPESADQQWNQFRYLLPKALAPHLRGEKVPALSAPEISTKRLARAPRFRQHRS